MLQAAFYFKQADALASYIESNLDEMNQLRPLNVPEDPDDLNFVDVIEEDANEDADGSQNGLKTKDEQVTEEKGEDDDEPKIEDVIDSSS